MANKVFDRVQEFVTTKGTGAHVLSGVTPGGFRSYGSVLVNGDTFDYCCLDPSTGAWEVVTGTYNQTPNTITRTSVLANSLGTTAPINFGGNQGTYIFLAMSANMILSLLSGTSGGIVPDGTTLVLNPDKTISIKGQTVESLDDASLLDPTVLASTIVILRVPASGNVPGKDYRITLTKLLNSQLFDLSAATVVSQPASGDQVLGVRPNAGFILLPPGASGTTPPTGSMFTVGISSSTVVVGQTLTLTVSPPSGGWPANEVVSPVVTGSGGGTYDQPSKPATGSNPVLFVFTATSAGNVSLSASAPNMTLSGSVGSATVTTASAGGGSGAAAMTMSGAVYADKGDNSGKKMLTGGSGSTSLTFPSDGNFVVKIGMRGASNFNYAETPQFFVMTNSAGTTVGLKFYNRAAVVVGNGGTGYDPAPASLTDGGLHELAFESKSGLVNTSQGSYSLYIDGTNSNGARPGNYGPNDITGLCTIQIIGGTQTAIVTGMYDVRVYSGSMVSIGTLLGEWLLNGNGAAL